MIRWGELVRLRLRPSGGPGAPYGDEVVEHARKLVEETRLSQQEIGARIGISPTTVSSWARSGGWRRPPGAPRAADQRGQSLLAPERDLPRTRPWRLLREAEASLSAIAPSDLDGLERVLALVLEARQLHAQGTGRKRRRHGIGPGPLPASS